MTDTELVYALYVQANPVTNPDLLPLTRYEAELLTHERSRDMDTGERIDVQPKLRLPRRRGLAFGLGAILVAVVATAGLLLVASNGDEPVAAADAAPQVVFDGSSCRYDGPTLIQAGVVGVTVANTSAEAVAVAGFRMLESGLSAELERTPLGTDRALGPADPMPSAVELPPVYVSTGSERVGSWAMTAGMYIIDCVTYSEAGPAPVHVWRAGTLVEVVAP